MTFKAFTRAALAGALLVAGSSAVAQTVLRLADFLPPQHPYQTEVYGRMGEMTADQQAAFDRIGREIATIANGVQLTGTARGEQMFREMEGREWIDLTPEAAAEFNAASASVIEQVVAALEAEGRPARAFVDALQN
ncbi:hypothetical protein [Pararhodobacter sp.]|uniref:hypothetical protein n=1 Tax=Pararhodobacter sp. TaxID=2127056 RepID=UPI002AFF793B|nr:hypothetical protein [Pararhodobacter sp.]